MGFPIAGDKKYGSRNTRGELMLLAYYLKFDNNYKVSAVQVYDASGKSVPTQLLNDQLDVRNLQNGVYLIKITTDKGTSTQKFIKK